MTLRAALAPATDARDGRRGRIAPPPARELFEWSVGAVIAVTLAFVVVPARGGRDGRALQAGLLVTVAGFVLTRSWRHLQPRVLLLLAALPASALATCVLSPTGGAGLREAGGYAYAAITFAWIAAFTRTAGRRGAAVMAIVGLGLDQFGKSLLPWWGGEDPARPMVGTFYWHNQYGAYMLAIAVVAGAMAVFGVGVHRRAGQLIAPILGVAVVLSASRASILLLSAGWLAVGLAACVQRTDRLRSLARWLAVGVGAVAVSMALTSSMFFPSAPAADALSGVERRNASSDTARGNVDFRVQHNKAAIRVFLDNPVRGTGFQGYGAASSQHLPFGLTRSPYVHNGILQAATDGGLLLLIPLVAALASALVALLRLLVRRGRCVSLASAEVACAAAALLLLAHAAVDFDWTYPALVALLAALLGIALSESVRRHEVIEQKSRRNYWNLGAAAALPVLVVLGLAGVDRGDGALEAINRIRPSAGDEASVRLLLEEDMRLLPDARIQMRALSIAVPVDFAGSARVSAETASALIGRTARLGAVNASVQLQRAQLLVALGEHERGLRIARAVVEREGAARPFLSGEYAETLAGAGKVDEAIGILVGALADDRLTSEVGGVQLEALRRTLERLAPDPSAATACALWRSAAQLAQIRPRAGAVAPRPPGCADPAKTPTAP